MTCNVSHRANELAFIDITKQVSSHFTTGDFIGIPGTMLGLVIGHPSVLPSIRIHLPRPRTLRALLESLFLGPGKPLPGRHVAFPRDYFPIVKSDDPNMRLMPPWSYWRDLEATSQMNKECMRRGCTHRGKKICVDCKQTVYCGGECQKQ